MARTKTANLPDDAALRMPPSPLLLALEQVMLRGTSDARTSVSIGERIAVRLAGAITLDRVRSGQRLLESDISTLMQVSRAPVREALRILERDRLVEFKPRRGAIVTAPDQAELRDVFTIRSTLYCLLLAQVMEDNPEQLDAVFSRHLPRLEAAAKAGIDPYALEGFLLNIAVFDLCANRLLGEMLKSISLRTLRYVRLGLAHSPHSLGQSLRTWRMLQRAIQRRDIAKVLDTARSRMSTTRDAAVRALLRPR